MGRLRKRIGANGLRDSRRRALQHRHRRFRCHVARAEPGAAGRQDESRFDRELFDRLGDRVTLVRDDSPDDLVALTPEELLQHVAARVLTPAHVDAVGDCQHRSLHSGAFVFSTSRTSASSIPSSTAFAMS